MTSPPVPSPRPTRNQNAVPMSEAQLQAAIIGAAEAYGWLIHHDRPARRADGSWRTAISGHRGFPDLLMAHPVAGRVVAAELKSARGKPTVEQLAWISGFAAAGVEAYLWRPADLDRALEIINPRWNPLPSE